MPELQGSGYLVVVNLIWWAAYMHAFYLSFIAEKKRSIQTAAASALVPTSALIPAISTAQVPTPPQARSQAPSAGIDPVVLAKANGGDAVSQRLVGRAYEKGEGVPQDYAQAALWFRKAAEQGNAEAQFILGDLYYEGKGVPQDYTQAALWYRKAAEQGDTLAQGGLGLLYESGHGVPQDYAEAHFWFDLAAGGEREASQAEAATKIRDEIASHLTPADLSREQERARKWFEAHQAKPQ
jgi:TPR repeat protein